MTWEEEDDVEEMIELVRETDIEFEEEGEGYEGKVICYGSG